ncbi:MAG: Gfo/Idh/MocA family oxidoreductase, partial [Verrucomicrobiales bacterium]|nr:Gfo/Idh/MocA family oxidoreductase [Verrucomicrobiales bacterium]
EASACLGPVPFVTDARAVLEADDVDGVVILTSMPQHAPLARAALEAGKHVLVEKPLATRLEDASALAELARWCGRHLVCAPFTTLSPTFRTLLRHVRAGAIGKVCSARARYGWAGPWWSEWFYRPGGGCLFDLGIYSVTTLTGLLGPARRVMAMTGIAIPEREIHGRTIRVEAEDNAQVLLDFGGGASAVVTTGFTLQQYRSPALELYGTTGVLQMLGDDWDPDGYELWRNDAGCWQIHKETHPDWPWTDGLRDWVEAILENRPPATRVDHALHVLEVLLAAQRSGREGRAVDIERTFEPLTPTEPETAGASEPAHRVHDRTREHDGRRP